MRVSLQIDGDASGAKQAAEEASSAISDLGQRTGSTSTGIEDALKKATGALDGLKDSGKAAGAANDNVASAAIGLSGKLTDLASKAAGAEGSLSKVAAGAVSVARGIADTVKSVGVFGVIGSAISLATTVASTFYSVINSGNERAKKDLDETARLVGVVRDAYRDAGKVAYDFYTQSQKITQLQAQQALVSLQNVQQQNASTFLNKYQPGAAGAFTGSIPGEDFTGGLAGTLFSDQTNQRFAAFSAQFEQLRQSINAGTPDFAKFRDDIAALGIAAATSNPQLAAAAAEIIKVTQPLAEAQKAIAQAGKIAKDGATNLNDQEKKLFGITTSTNDASASFERFLRSADRQSASLEAETRAVGGSAGAIAKLRAESVLTEAAQQAGADTAAKYADQVAKVAARAGDAAQKLAEARLRSDVAFDRAQLGRTADDQAVASQLRGTFGDNADMDSAIANTIRLNNDLKELKSTTQELGSGAFRDFRNELMSGASAFQALEKAGINALSRIADKLLDKTLDAGLSSLFGGFNLGFGSSSMINVGNYAMPKIGFDGGGWTGAGGKYDVAGVVHRAEFVFDKEPTRRIGIANLERLRRGDGFADGGFTGGSTPWSGMSATGSGVSASVGAQAVHVSVGVSVDDDGNLKAVVKNISTSVASDSIGQYVSSPAFVSHVGAASKKAKTWKQL
ncbi:hypothetical protein HU230_0007920 [Bradyrhizobium quebecense]|uniref:Bacteriophage tail tape measure N-terminal domain-containing protein n=1 Tax=Bradyrhizobium quebecense TaxID=2748629 RepID=A0A974AHK0_9BRAD|nr:hypothetical protein [Bradyrhizobium quebecense]UGA45953.1 hypothetical protein HU230_0007920 [Bradyrhizobium quebecense]